MATLSNGTVPRTRVGFVGAGIIANRHLDNLLTFEDVRVTAVADPRLDRARDFAGRCGSRMYGDYAEMLDKEQLDAVYICVPPFAHGSPEAAVIQCDLPFFVEKPLAAQADTAETIAAGVANRGLVTATGYHWRYLDTTERAQELLARNEPRLAVGFWLDATPPPEWWVSEALSGGQMIEQTTHIFDLARLLVGDIATMYAAGARIERPAFAHADVSDVSTVMLSFASGALGTISSTCLLNWRHRVELQLYCEGMAIELSEFDMIVDVGQGRPLQQAQGDPILREDRDFLDAVQGKPNRVRAPYGEAIKSHRLACAATVSAKQGRALELEPDTARVRQRDSVPS